MNKDLAEKIEELTKQRQVVKEAEGEVLSAKSVLTACKKTLNEEQSELNSIIDEIDDLQHGQPRLPFDQHSTSDLPALETVARKMAESKAPDRLSDGQDLNILLGFGASESMVKTVSESLGISSVGQLRHLVETDTAWHQQVSGFGEKKKVKIEQALNAFLASQKPSTPVEQDNRMKKCLKCEAFRDQSQERCQKCNDTAFELDNPPSDFAEESEFDPDYVQRISIALEDSDALASVHTYQHPETHRWHSSFSVMIPGIGERGREVPHHASTGYEDRTQAIQAAALDAENAFFDCEMDSEASSVREFKRSFDVSNSDLVAEQADDAEVEDESESSDDLKAVEHHEEPESAEPDPDAPVIV